MGCGASAGKYQKKPDDVATQEPKKEDEPAEPTKPAETKPAEPIPEQTPATEPTEPIPEQAPAADVPAAPVSEEPKPAADEQPPARPDASSRPAGVPEGMPFLGRLAPNGQRWLEYCGPAPPTAHPELGLVGAWGECMMSAVVFEVTNPDWSQRPEYAADGAGGQIIKYCHARGFSEFVTLLAEAEERMRQEMQGAEGDPLAFLRFRCRNGKSWKDYLSTLTPTQDKGGLLNGAWGDCITAAVIFESENPEWSKLPMYMEDGPAGQVIKFFTEQGHEPAREAMDRTEKESHEAVASGGKLPVYEEVYQPTMGTTDAPEVGEDPPEMTGRKKALLVGCNYKGTSAELNGCINDVHTWKDVLTSLYSFEEKDMLILTDDQDDPMKRPTLASMRSGLQWLVAGAQKGDVLFWQFSGHGAQVRSKLQTEADGKDEALIPTDYSWEAGVFVDDEIFDLAVTPLPSGVKLTIILDCCHSGTAVDLPFIWQEGGGWEEVGGTSYTAGDVQMFSGCEDQQCSMDVTRHGKAQGAMTGCMTQAIREDPSREYPALLARLHEILQEQGMEQRPRLTSSQKFDGTTKSFNLCEGAVPNLNPVLGCTGPPRLQPDRDEAGGLAALFGV